MKQQILLISDIHGNYPALQAVAELTSGQTFSHIINTGDSLVYAPFPDETISWLIEHDAVSIRGNTDKKVGKLLAGKEFNKPADPEKRIMYTSTAEALQGKNRSFVLALQDSTSLTVEDSGRRPREIGMFHGSPADPKEFLFADTPDSRFAEIARTTSCDIIVTGHSHTPYVKIIEGKCFINPGSVGRMFDSDPRGCFAILTLAGGQLFVHHIRVAYDIDRVTTRLEELGLPAIYGEMFRTGRKLN